MMMIWTGPGFAVLSVKRQPPGKILLKKQHHEANGETAFNAASTGVGCASTTAW